MKKKIFTLLFAILASIGIVNGMVKIGDVYYALDDINHTAEAYEGRLASGDFIIPSSITYNNVEYIVIGIHANCFSWCNLTSVTIPNSVTSIGEGAFSDCTGLTSVTIPNSVTSIGDHAFKNCQSLTSVTIPDGITSIGDETFYKCYGLTSLTIPNSITSIGSNAFSNCTGLTSIEIPNSVTSIEDFAFWYCSGLTSVTIGCNVTSIGQSAFNTCDNITSVIWNAKNCTSVYETGYFGLQVESFVFGTEVETIPENCCRRMTKLTSMTIPNSVTSIGSSAFRDCSGLTSVTIPNSVTSIGDNAFLGCSSLPVIDNVRYADTYLVEAVDKTLSTYAIKDGTKFIGTLAFYDCGGMTSIEIPNSVINIASGAFLVCSSLTSIAIPTSVTSIGDYAFYDCSVLSSITCNAITPPTLGADVFYGVNKSIPLFVPEESVNEYNAAGQWKDFDIIAIGNVGETFTVTFKDWDGTVLKTQQVEKGHAATAPANPTREGYTFTGWDKDFSNVQSDLTVTAQYTQNSSGTTSFTVTFQDWDGTVLKSEQVDKGKSATAPTNPTREGYTFTGWDKTFSNVQSDLMITAQYKKNNPSSPFVGFESTDAHSLATQIYSENLIQNITNVTLVETDAAAHKYSINLVNGGEGTFSMGGVVFSYTNAEAGKTAYKTYIQYIQPNGVDREIRIPTVKGQQIRVTLVENCAGMLVDGVSKDFVAGDNIITANGSSLVITNPTAKPKITAIKPYAFVGSSEYTVTFKDWNGKILKAEIVAEGMSATAPANPTREGYTFTGWDKDFNNVQSDLIITAQYTQNTPSTTYYTVTFQDWNGIVLKTEQVEAGHAATAPANPTREGYTFTGWDKDFNNVQSDLIITAQYERMNEAVENVQAENITSRKVMINGQIFILRGEKIYTVDGRKVR